MSHATAPQLSLCNYTLKYSEIKPLLAFEHLLLSVTTELHLPLSTSPIL